MSSNTLKKPLLFCVLMIAVLLMSFIPDAGVITVYLAGDSTMSIKAEKALPENGWGMPFATFFDDRVKVDNRAQNGRSTKTFISEGLWQGIHSNLKKGDYVLIQFGHNDEIPTKAAAINEDGYRNNLLKFISEIREKKANPILITPVARRKFDSTATIVGTHDVYAAIVRQVAANKKVPLIDLDAEGQQLLQKYGPDESKKLFNYLKPGESPNYPDGRVDDTHFSTLGARKIAGMVAMALKRLKIDLAAHLVKGIDTPNTSGITGVPDTSFNNLSAYRHILKDHPDIKIVSEASSATVKETRGLTYCSIGKRKLQIDAFVPAAKAAKTPAVLIVHGGGWRSGNRAQHIPLAQSLAKAGYAAFTVEYRLSTEALYPAGVFDIKAALRWLRSQGNKFNIDTAKVAILGFSAGGELAAFVGVTSCNARFEDKACAATFSSNVQAVIDIDGTLSFVHPESREGGDANNPSAAARWFGFQRADAYELWADASPLNHARENKVPFLFINSSAEWMHAGRDDFRKIMDKKGIYTEVHTFDNSPHTFCLFEPWFQPTVQHITVFLKKVFK